TADEIQNVRTATGAFNNIIFTRGKKYNIPVSDLNYVMGTVFDEGTQYNGADYTAVFLKGGIFSLDGRHFTGRGNALVANSIIHTINDYYGSSIPLADVNSYSGIRLP